MKETYYFSHDYYANKDPKCSALINDFGMMGYGLYWCLVEILHEQGGKIKKFPKLIEGLAFQLKLDNEILAKQIKAMIEEYNLLQEDENFIWSDRVMRNLEERKIKYQAKADAGRIGGLKSGESRNKHSILKQNEAMLQANEVKERKGKEIKVKYLGDSVSPNTPQNTPSEEILQGNLSSYARDCKPPEEKENDSYDDLLEYWNAKQILVHRKLSPLVKKYCDKLTKEGMTIFEIKKSIDNYSEILDDKRCFFKYKWALHEFLQREGGARTFFEKTVEDYRTKEKY